MKNICLLITICLFSVILASCGHDEIAEIDLENSISWSSLSSYEMNWYEAQDYCTNLRERGHDDWHLPSAEELETVVKNYTGNPCLENDIYCLFEYRENKEIYYIKTGDVWLWTNDKGSDINYTTAMWAVMFLEDHMQTELIEFHENYHVRCVRSKCTSGYSWNNGKCETAQTRTADCTDLPRNANWNTVSQITQTWNGYSWLPTNKSRHNEEPSTTECRFKCNSGYSWIGEKCDKSYHDPARNMLWSRRSPTCMTGLAAAAYCDSLSEEGFRDWRLPTISELRTLIKNCHGTKSGGSCNVTDTCLSFDECWDSEACSCDYDPDESGKYSELGDTNALWSSSMDDYNFVWVVKFASGDIESENINYPLYVRCVRSE
ncbi:DUF1566 domain-containing protein [bacterium]|nr:DUF1566 domain-containing protein [bacterium]